ncbi:Arc family DNA-binding protein [Pseudomonas sp. PDM26]|uniref:Arc family DNA-binding protein n=1 Tax=Pseudomonas TaxID=286 RepID=UPI001C44A9D9|nr:MULTISPECIES: Arc family DNA-binding protein [Pseudomonas]MBV7547412.1 Arc family DNA-binding protein [Pseudomonas sp. PDM26]MCT9824828.1 Arc family DNA-binding protein [Pseudomonas veronii]
MTALSIATTAHAAALPPRPCRRVRDSRKADKFVLSTHTTIIDALDEIARSHCRSVNSEIIMAVTEALDGNQRTTFDRQLYVNHLGEARASLILVGVPHVDLSAMRGDHTTTVRLPDGIREAVAMEAGIMHLSMMAWMLKALQCWINDQRDIHALQNACVETQHQDRTNVA